MTRVATLEWGPTNGPTILLVHGGGDNAATWVKIGPSLAHLGHVVAVDLPGHGRSGPIPDPGEGPLDLHTPLLQVVGDDPLVYVGHSLGAPVALALARLRPPSGIVLVDGSPHRRILQPPEPFNEAAEEAKLRSMGYDTALKADELEAKVAADPEPEACRRAYARRADNTYERRPNLATTLTMAKAGRHVDNPYRDLDLYRHPTAPTRVLAATRGTAADVRAEVDALYADNPRVEVEWLESSHSLHWDQPEAVIQAVEHLATR